MRKSSFHRNSVCLTHTPSHVIASSLWVQLTSEARARFDRSPVSVHRNLAQICGTGGDHEFKVWCCFWGNKRQAVSALSCALQDTDKAQKFWEKRDNKCQKVPRRRSELV